VDISDDWMSADMFLDLARGCERACMDYMLLGDSIYVGETWQNTRDIYLMNGMSIPRQDQDSRTNWWMRRAAC
jgi:hypothetical protein